MPVGSLPGGHIQSHKIRMCPQENTFSRFPGGQILRESPLQPDSLFPSLGALLAVALHCTASQLPLLLLRRRRRLPRK